MGKRERHFERVARYREQFRRLSTEVIRYRLINFGTALHKEAAIALRELLEEREGGQPRRATRRTGRRRRPRLVDCL